MPRRPRVKKSPPKSNVPPYATSLWLPLDLRDDLQAEAKKQQRSRSWVMLSILKQWQAWMKAKKNSPKMPEE